MKKILMTQLFLAVMVTSIWALAFSSDGDTPPPLEGADKAGGGSRTGMFNVLDYGAVGNGKSDDTPAIQAAINAGMSSGGGVVYFPPGLYKITEGLSVEFSGTSVAQLDFQGAGKHTSRLLYFASGSEDLLEIDCWDGTSKSFNIRDLGFSLASGVGGNGLSIWNASRGEINNCYIYGFARGAGIKFDAAKNKHGDLCRVVGTYVGACRDGIWSDCSGSSGSYCNANLISNCTIISNIRYDVLFSNSGGIPRKAGGHFIDNTWIQCLTEGTHGVFIADDVSSVKMSNTNLDGSIAATVVSISPSSKNTRLSNVIADGKFDDRSGKSHFSSCYSSVSGDVTSYKAVYDVVAFGAIGDGSTDDAKAIQSALDACIAAGSGTIYFPPRDYALGSGLRVLRPSAGTVSQIVIDAYGARVIASEDLGEPVLRIGSTGQDIDQVIVRGGTWGFDGRGAFSDPNSACIKIVNGTGITMYDVTVLNGHDGLLLAAGATFENAYNIFYNSSIRTCLNAIHLDCESKEGMVKENLFHGGRISYAQGSYDASSGTAISLTVVDDPSHLMSGNRFVDMSVECSMVVNKPQLIFDEHGSWNQFIRLQNEGFPTPLMKFGVETKWDLWDGAVSDNQNTGTDEVVAAADQGKVTLRMFPEVNSLAAKVRIYDLPDPTPSVGNVEIMKFLAGSGSAVITQLKDGVPNQTVTLVCLGGTNFPKIYDGGNFNLSADWVPGIDDTLTLFTNTGAEWIEVSRSNN